MGALIMTHSDNNGLVLPPRLAPIQVVIVPIYRSSEEYARVNEAGEKIRKELLAKGISVKFDNRDTHKPGWKFNEYELKGVPLRIAIGPRDLDNNQVELARRDLLSKETVPMDNLSGHILNLLDEIQENLQKKALDFRTKNTVKADDYETFKTRLDDGCFVLAHWDGSNETEERIKEETKATIRCIPFDSQEEEGSCILTGKPSKQRVLFARAY